MEEKPSEKEQNDILENSRNEFDFSSDAAAEESMKIFIKNNFRDTFGDKIDIIDEPDGLNKIQTAFQEEIDNAGENLHKNISELIKLIRKLQTRNKNR